MKAWDAAVERCRFLALGPSARDEIVDCLRIAYELGANHERRRRSASAHRRYVARRGRCSCGIESCPFLAGRKR